MLRRQNSKRQSNSKLKVSEELKEAYVGGNHIFSIVAVCSLIFCYTLKIYLLGPNFRPCHFGLYQNIGLLFKTYYLHLAKYVQRV